LTMASMSAAWVVMVYLLLKIRIGVGWMPCSVQATRHPAESVLA
jgi:hypothetical protein